MLFKIFTLLMLAFLTIVLLLVILALRKQRMDTIAFVKDVTFSFTQHRNEIEKLKKVRR